MADEQRADTQGSLTVMCRRLGHARDVQEHVSCPYCYGLAEEVGTGEHDRFCDYDAERDPILFGFPDDKGRLASE